MRGRSHGAGEPRTVQQVVSRWWPRWWPRVLVAAVLALSIGVARPAVTDGAPLLSPLDEAAYRTAFTLAKVQHWPKAFEAAQRSNNPLAAKVLTWAYVADPSSGAPFARIAEFLDNNPTWPLADTLRRNAEQALAGEPPSARTIEWFAKHPPRSGAGMVRLAMALQNVGRTAEAADWARRAYTTAALPNESESTVLAQWGRQLTPADHDQRLDALLWLGRPNEAKRLVPRIPLARRAVAEARIALATQSPGVDGALARVGAAQMTDPGLLYERVRWRRRNGNTQGAIDLLAPMGPQLAHEDPWWDERIILARRALDSGRITDAYRIAAAHGQTDRADIADAEWLAGWIALEFLSDPAAALEHFLKMHAQVRLPVSVARASYWAGRAAAKLGRTVESAGWFEKAARFGTTYYGQLALERLDANAKLQLPAEPVPTAADAHAFLSEELAQAVLLLAQLEEHERVRPFLVRLADRAQTPAQAALVTALAERIGRPDLAVATAKLAQQSGTLLAYAGYPVLAPPAMPVEPALVLALVRQESEFHAGAKSHAGALGLMQLMPATARSVALAQKVKYEPTWLTADPDYNLRLGTAHLTDLLESFRGSYVLSLAAYNAGESRVRGWMKTYGDPRDPAIDVVDWIEQIPIEETRNYVQRVMENIAVYRARLAGEQTPLTLTKDLRR